MAITITKLQCFQKVAETQSFTRASYELNIAQPSLSRTISSLEDDVGYSLFDHVGRNVVLNKRGEIVKVYADRILSNLDSLQRELNNTSIDSKNTVTICLSSASSFIPGLLTAFNKIYPDIQFDIIQNKTVDNVATPIKADLYIFSSVTPMDSDFSATLLKEDIFIAVPENDPLAKNKTCKLSDFADRKFLSLQAGQSLRIVTDYYCNMVGFVPHIFIESDSAYTIREFIKAGMGVAFAPEYTWREVMGDKVATIALSSPNCCRYICISWSKSGYLSDAALKFKNFLIQNFENYAKTRVLPK